MRTATKGGGTRFPVLALHLKKSQHPLKAQMEFRGLFTTSASFLLPWEEATGDGQHFDSDRVADPDFVIALVCAILGAFVLSRFTLSLGMLTYPINFCCLFLGAVLANLFMKQVRLPLDYDFDRPLFISLAGMAVASVIMLVFLSRDRLSD